MLENLKSDIVRLIALYEGECKRAEELEAKLSESRAEVEACRQQIAELNRQIDNQRLSSAFSATENNAEAKQRLDRLIARIDKCIALLEV